MKAKRIGRMDAYAALVIDGRESGPRQWCPIDVVAVGDAFMVRIGRRVKFTAARSGVGRSVFFDHAKGGRVLMEFDGRGMVAGDSMDLRP